MGVNKVILVGNLGRDPEVRYTSNQTAIATISVATSERRKDATGNWANHTEWHRVVAFGKLAEFCNNYVKKGSQVYLEGKIRTNKWQDKEGKDRYTTEILADTIQFVGGKDRGDGSSASGPSSSGRGGDDSAIDSLVSADSMSGSSGNSGPGDVSFDDDDIPF